MTPLNQMSYDEFGKLRFLDFFPHAGLYQDDDVGGMETGIGIACTEGYKAICFARPQKSSQTAEIILEFDQDCPEIEANKLLDQLGLRLRRGMSSSEVKAMLGVPEEDDRAWLRFVVGTNWPYYVGCMTNGDKGLCRVWICRKDLADREEEKFG